MKKLKIAIVDIIGLNYDGTTLTKKGIGGSESSIISVAKELAKIGFDVSIFNDCDTYETQPGIYDNVVYRPVATLGQQDFNFDIVISQRTVIPFTPPELYDQVRQPGIRNHEPEIFAQLRRPSQLKILWMQDTFIWGDHLLEHLIIKNHIDEIFCISDWHISYTTHSTHGPRRNFEVLKDKIFLTRNAINRWIDWVDIKAKDPDLFVYNASVTKGMIPLVEKIWPRVKQQFPNAKLKIIGGYYKFRDEEVSGAARQVMDLQEKTQGDPSIEFTGIIPQPKIAEIMASASYNLYPGAYPETSGISSLESINYNTPIIGTRFGAMEETATESSSYFINFAIEPNGLFPWINQDSQINKYLDLVTKVVNDPYLHQQKQYACNAVKDVSTWDTVALQWKQHFYHKLGLSLDSHEQKKVDWINYRVHKVFGRRYMNPEEVPRLTRPQTVGVLPAPRVKMAIVDIVGMSYDGNTLNKKGLGGSESAVILISQNLAKMGFDVTVFNGCNEDGAMPGIYNGVNYRPLTDITQLDETYDVVISSRSVTPFVTEPWYYCAQTSNRKIDYRHFEQMRANARLKIFWMHDTFCWGDDILEDLVSANAIDEIWTLSDFHAMYVMNCSHPRMRSYEVLRNHVWTTRNGLVRYFDHVDLDAKDPDLFIFNANMSKGLDPLLNLVWPRVKQQLPMAKLTVIGGFYKLGSAFAHDNEESEFMKIAGAHMTDPTITFTGIINQQEVAEISARASYFIYPAALPETYGISTIEALHANTPLLTCRFGALGETASKYSYYIDYALLPNGLFPDINAQDQTDKFVNMVVEAYRNPQEHRRRMQALDEIKELLSWEVTALEWKQHIYSKLGLYLSKDENQLARYTKSRYHEFFNRKFSTREEWVAPKQDQEQLIVIISPFYNAERYIEKCILSVAAQDYENYEHWLIDDASTDQSYAVAQRLIQQLPENIKGKFRLFRNEENYGAVANHVNALRRLDDSTVVMLLDGDDSLTNCSDIFDYYNYIHQNYDFTHGSSWSMVDSIPLVSQPYPPDIRDAKAYRSYKFNWNMPYTHLRTLKAKLLKYEPDSVFQDSTGAWYKAGGDNATFYRAIENVDPGRIYVVSDIVYNYNDINPLNDYKVNRPQQDQAIREILDKNLPSDILDQEYRLASLPTVTFANGLVIDNDIYEHLPKLLELANECETVTEFGVRWGYSTRAFLLSKSKLISYDIELNQRVTQLFDIARQTGKDCSYLMANTLELTIDETDLLFVDTDHSYEQLQAELNRHHARVKKYIVFHDTHTFGTTGQAPGDKKGLLTAIIEFMRDHPEWRFKYHTTNNNGLTVIERFDSVVQAIEQPVKVDTPKKRILLAIPTNRNIEAQTFKSIYDLEVPDGYQVDFQYFWGYQVDQVRNLIAEWVIRYNYDYLFSVDSDIAFTADTLKKMLAHDVDMVTGIYIQRIPETHTIEVMRKTATGGVSHVNFADIAGQGLVPIDACGFGCLLIKGEVIRSIPYPHFVYKSAIDHANTYSEDVYFCTQATERGFKVWADTSIICDHIGSWTFRVNTKINEPKLPGNVPLRLETDSEDYYILKNAVKMVKEVPGMLCEIGTRRGGSLKLIIDTLLENQDHNRNVIGLDPYGNLEYISSEGQRIRYDYDNAMRNETFVALYSYIQGKPVNLVMHVLEDTEFFRRFSDGVAFYNNQKNYETSYSFVFFDGPYDVKAIIAEMEFFNQRSSVGAIWVLNNVHTIPYDIIKEWLRRNNFVMLEESKIKASYKKM